MDRKEGILLQGIAYLGSHRILKVFTPDGGLLTFMAKHKKAAWATPFCRAEWVYKKSSGDIHVLQDASLIDPLLPLRQSYEILSAAGAMASDVLQSQLPGKEAPEAYLLLIAYFRKLGECANSAALRHSFRLKLLQVEGLLHFGKLQEHLSLNDLDWAVLQILGLSRSFDELQKVALSGALVEKLDRLFLNALSR